MYFCQQTSHPQDLQFDCYHGVGVEDATRCLLHRTHCYLDTAGSTGRMMLFYFSSGFNVIQSVLKLTSGVGQLWAPPHRCGTSFLLCALWGYAQHTTLHKNHMHHHTTHTTSITVLCLCPLFPELPLKILAPSDSISNNNQ